VKVEVRDPIHGAIDVESDELAILDDPFVQRLRQVRQTGFSYLPFPGATHSRYAHCVGVMHLAGQAFDKAFTGVTLGASDRRDLRRALRIAALCHDLGHAPFSHCAEFAMPPLASLGIQWYGAIADPGRKATHEDYTVAILERTPLVATIAACSPFTARHVAALISADVAPADDFFVRGGLDYRRILSQIVSSELDVDRLDYLRRDSYFTGARYGEIDASWILGNLAAVNDDGNVTLALDARAIYAFDHFLLARHHMFLMVYFHHKSVVYEEMLRRHVSSKDRSFAIPADLEAYLGFDDVALESVLRTSAEPWARRIVERRPYQRLVERHGKPGDIDFQPEKDKLFDAGIGVIHAASTGRLSRYAAVGKKRNKAPPIAVLDRLPGMPVERVRTLSMASDVFENYAQDRLIARLYVAPEELDRARVVLGLPAARD
jgi:HD superfamily phosphohydrolase